MSNRTYVFEDQEKTHSRSSSDSSLRVWREPEKYLTQALQSLGYMGVRYEGRRSRGGGAEVYHLRAGQDGIHLVLKTPHTFSNKDEFRLEGKVQQRAHKAGTETPEIVASHEFCGRHILLMEERGRPLACGDGVRYTSKRIAEIGYALATQLVILQNEAFYPGEIHPGILHNDLKPKNILEEDKKIVLIDYAAAAPLGIRQGRILTIQYTAPERLTSDLPLDGRADVFSIAVVIYELTTGKPPYPIPEHSIPDHRAISHFSRVKDQTHVPLKECFGASIRDANFSDLVDAMLKYNPHARPSMGEVKRELKNYQ